MYYAQLDPTTRICCAVTENQAPIESPFCIEIDNYDVSKLGMHHNAETGEFEAVPQPRASIPKIEYLRRFTQSERVAIRLAAAANHTVNDYVELLNATTTLHLDDPDVIAGVNSLESAGLLAAGRAAEILA
jgi:hypothetical protein